MSSKADTIATVDMVAHCFTVLINHLNGRHERPAIPVQQVGGMFVTWERNGDLRGCIGCLQELSLDRLSDYAISSSQRDSRFKPISQREIHELECTVSILHSFKKCEHMCDWTVGLHGIIVAFEWHGRDYRSTFLPNVMPEQTWDQTQAVTAAVRKSGFNGKLSEVSAVITVTRYESSKATLTYEEYVQFMQNR